MLRLDRVAVGADTTQRVSAYIGERAFRVAAGHTRTILVARARGVRLGNAVRAMAVSTGRAGPRTAIALLSVERRG